jgi:hypothetical protein
MLSDQLQERFDMLLTSAKDPAFKLIAMENIAAAREMLDTLFASDLLGAGDYRAYQSQVSTAQLVVTAAQLKRAQDARIWDMNLFDGSRI